MAQKRLPLLPQLPTFPTLPSLSALPSLPHLPTFSKEPRTSSRSRSTSRSRSRSRSRSCSPFTRQRNSKVAAAENDDPNAPALPVPFTKLVVFGDSYSDTGSNYTMTHGKFPPSPPYEGKFCNGPIWCEYLANEIGATLENYSEGGATTDNNFVQGHTSPTNILVNGIYQQIQNVYLPLAIPLPPSDPTLPSAATTLFALWSNGNDFHVDKLLSINKSARNLIRSVELLRSSVPSAQHFLLFHCTNLGQMPHFQVHGIGLRSLGHPFRSTLERGVAVGISATFNSYLDTLAEEYMSKHPGVKLTVFETDKEVTRLRSEGTRFGLTNVTDQCVALSGKMFVVADNVDKYMYWDSVHLATKVHEVIAKRVATMLGKVYGKEAMKEVEMMKEGEMIKERVGEEEMINEKANEGGMEQQQEMVEAK